MDQRPRRERLSRIGDGGKHVLIPENLLLRASVFRQFDVLGVGGMMLLKKQNI
ncbi:MAG TPA: hypothetical protein VK669_09160 [Candidatus Limnocylindrales bacterium]|nr:hypothetical protein [Candidatus Limnocylindrales bacterium]